MDPSGKDQLLQDAERLDSRLTRLSSNEAEDLFLGILAQLFHKEGYKTTRKSHSRGGGIDLLACKRPTTDAGAYKLGVEFRYVPGGITIDVEEVRQMVGGALLHDTDRAIVAINTNFSKEAKRFVEQQFPIDVELVDLAALRTWIGRLEVEDEIHAKKALEILSVASRELALLIAQNPRALDYIEWRDVERVLASVFRGIGFRVRLTPGSKDGGKDLVLEFCSMGVDKSYIVEAKHWRSGNKVGQGAVGEFLRVLLREDRHGGLFLSTYGFASNAFEQLTSIDRQRIRFGDQAKIAALCRTYTKTTSGIWSIPQNLQEILYEGTS